MPWTRILLIALGTGIVTSMTDWFFAADWLHHRFTYPEIWRRGSETKAIAVSCILSFVTCGIFTGILAWLGLRSLSYTLALAGAIWLLGPLPLILTNAAFIKLHRVFVVSYATGWLVKLGIVACATGWFL